MQKQLWDSWECHLQGVDNSVFRPADLELLKCLLGRTPGAVAAARGAGGGAVV